MSVKSPKFPTRFLGSHWLDVAAVTAWGLLLLKYAIDGTLYILIHPSYFSLVTVTGVALLIIGGLHSWRIYRTTRGARPTPSSSQDVQHISLLPSGITTALLLTTAIVGLIVTPRLFTSHTAIQRGVTEDLTVTRTQTKSFRLNDKPETRSLVDWIRTLNRYPEPDAYTGQKVNVNGFVVYPPDLPKNYLLLSRFVITCCAADAYPIALTIKFNGDRQTYPTDSWLQIQGKMTTETLQGKRQLVVDATTLTPIPTPKTPYES
jgi:uncharacterized repeat protein (TIGR03943 family)